MKKLTILLIVPFLSSCSATMESSLSKNSPYAPVNEINGGTVSYLNDGYLSIKEKRREDAYKKMHERCNGPYRIVSEEDRSENMNAAPIGAITYIGVEHHRYIHFECVTQ